MNKIFKRLWREDDGVLTFEWVLLISVLTIGTVGGISAVRDGMLTELGDVTEAMISLDQSYTILNPWEITTPDCLIDGASDSFYTDEAGMTEVRKLSLDGPDQVIGPCGLEVESGVTP